MSKVIIVCGFPGSGKTTLARALSKKLNIVCLHKDTFKENLYDTQGLTSLEDSKRIGHDSIRLLLAMAEEQLVNGVDVILEAPFTFLEDYKIFQSWIDKYSVKIYSVICYVALELRKERFLSRPRHPAHHDMERIGSGSFEETPNVYDLIPGYKIRLETNKPVEQLVKEVTRVVMSIR